MDLNTIWFLLFFVLIGGYGVLDGFDLGVGVLHLFTRDRNERLMNIRAIGPVWDGNEVWLLTGGGALFAAFPVVYATVFSSFYLAFMLLLLALIFRASALEFGGQVDSPRWQRFWDWIFGIASLIPSVLYGAAVGNVLRGLPLDDKQIFTGSFLGLLNPYSLLIGLLSLALFILQGAAWLRLKTEGPQNRRLQSWVTGAWCAVIILYSAATLATIFNAAYLFDGLLQNPLFWATLILLLISLIYIPLANQQNKSGRLFLFSSLLILCVVALTGLSLYPMMVPAQPDLSNSLNIYNSSSTAKTLKVMLLIALIGMPVVIGYTVFVYRVFKGKVNTGESGY